MSAPTWTVAVVGQSHAPGARERFSDVTAILTASQDAGAIRTGFAQLTPDDPAADVIARADNELLDQCRAADHR